MTDQCNFFNTNSANFLDQTLNPAEQQPCNDPLDMILLDDASFFPFKKRTRSSMESSDRQLEIPVCEPPKIGSRRYRMDSNSRGQRPCPIEPLSPLCSPSRNPILKLDSLLDNKDAYQESFMSPQRARRSSETCMSSNIPSSSGQQPSLSHIHFDPSETETYTIEHQVVDEKNNDDIMD